MGAISPSVSVSQEIYENVVEKVLRPTVRGLAEEGRTYCGVLYAGLMLTEDGPQVLEFNARFGDPETQVLLPRLKSDLALLLLAAAQGRLNRVEVEWNRDRAVCVVMASEGYPESYETGKAIQGLDRAATLPGVTVFHAGTRRQGEGPVLTAGGRVLSVSALGGTFEEARRTAYAAAEEIRFEKRYFRKDIGQDAVAFEQKAGTAVAGKRKMGGRA
jgi:phosphoribosylamine--glycine ligase